jgi:hypothetical protein
MQRLELWEEGARQLRDEGKLQKKLMEKESKARILEKDGDSNDDRVEDDVDDEIPMYSF